MHIRGDMKGCGKVKDAHAFVYFYLSWFFIVCNDTCFSRYLLVVVC